MTIPVFIDPGLLTGVCGILVGLICLLALRKHRIAAGRAHADLSVRMEQLEMRASILAPAPQLGTGRREMRLIAEVSRTLTLK